MAFSMMARVLSCAVCGSLAISALATTNNTAADTSLLISISISLRDLGSRLAERWSTPTPHHIENGAADAETTCSASDGWNERKNVWAVDRKADSEANDSQD